MTEVRKELLREVGFDFGGNITEKTMLLLLLVQGDTSLSWHRISLLLSNEGWLKGGVAAAVMCLCTVIRPGRSGWGGGLTLL